MRHRLFTTKLRARVRHIGKRGGMTLIEVLFAVVLLATALLGLGAFVTRFVHTISTENLRATASQLVQARLEQVKGATRYLTIESIYQGTESSIVGFPGYTRQTMVQHVGGGPADLYDYKVITVLVTAPGQPGSLKKTTIISNF